MRIHNGFELFVKSRGNGCYSFHSIHDALFHDKTLQGKFKVLSLGNSLEYPTAKFTHKKKDFMLYVVHLIISIIFLYLKNWV